MQLFTALHEIERVAAELRDAEPSRAQRLQQAVVDILDMLIEEIARREGEAFVLRQQLEAREGAEAAREEMPTAESLVDMLLRAQRALALHSENVERRPAKQEERHPPPPSKEMHWRELFEWSSAARWE